MALTECPECHGKVSSQADACPHCGFPVKTAPTLSPLAIPEAARGERKSRWPVAIAVALAIFTVCAVWFSRGQNPAPGGAVDSSSQTSRAKSRSRYSPPAYIKDVVAYKEGIDGFIVYIVLADASGAMTASDGVLSMRVAETNTYWSDYFREMMSDTTELYSAAISVSESQFRKTNAGLGAFEHEVLLLPLGRITYSHFNRRPSQTTGLVRVSFQLPSGKSLDGEETLFF